MRSIAIEIFTLQNGSLDKVISNRQRRRTIQWPDVTLSSLTIGSASEKR